MQNLVGTRGIALPASKPVSPWHVLVATWLGAFFDGMDATIYVMVLVPALSELLNSHDHSIIGWYGSIILAVFMLGWAVGAMIFGIVADHIGRARTLAITILIYALFTGLCATAHSWGELAIYRFLVGCGIGGEVGIGGVLLSECWKGRSRLNAVGVMVSAFGFGYLATSLLNLAFGHEGWRFLFLIGILPALVTLYLRMTLKDSPEFELMSEIKKRALSKRPEERNENEVRLLRPTFPDLFSGDNAKKTTIITVMASSAIMGYWAVLSWIPSWINQMCGSEAVNERSIVTILLNVGLISAAVMGGFLLSRFGRSTCFRIGSLGSFICCVTMFCTVKSFGIPLLILAFLTGYFTIVPFVVLFAYIPELFETRLRGTGFGFSYNLGRIFAGMAALGGGQLIGLFAGSYSMAAATLSGVYLIGVVASFFMPKTSGEVCLDVHH
jgi:MFS family permease